MLDIRTLLLLTPEDRYAPSASLRSAERAIYPLLREGTPPVSPPREQATLLHPAPA